MRRSQKFHPTFQVGSNTQRTNVLLIESFVSRTIWITLLPQLFISIRSFENFHLDKGVHMEILGIHNQIMLIETQTKS